MGSQYTASDDKLVFARFEHSTFHDMKVVTHFGCRQLNTTERDLGIGARGPLRQVDYDNHLFGHQQPVDIAPNAGGLRNRADRFGFE